MPGVPEARPGLGIDRPLEVVPAVLPRDLLDGLGLLLDARRGAVELEEQRRLLLQRRLAVAVDRGDGQRVEQLGARDRDAALDRPDDRVDRARDVREGADRGRHGLGPGVEPDRDLGDDAERPLAPDEDPREVVPRRGLLRAAGRADDLARRP